MTATLDTPTARDLDRLVEFTEDERKRWPKLEGRQMPETVTYTDGDDGEARRAIKLAARIRQWVFPWQRLFLTLCLLVDPATGLWANPDVVLIVPRQNGKSQLLLIRVIYGMFVRKEKILYTTQRWVTAEATYERLRVIVRAVPAWRKQIDKDNLSTGRGFMRLKNGAQVTMVTRSADTGRGLDEIDLVIFDEAYSLKASHVNAILPVQLAAKNPQTIYASSAVNASEHPDGWTLTGLRSGALALGRVNEDGLAFLEHMAPDSAGPRDEPSTWPLANPSFGMIQTVAKMRKALRGATSPDAVRGFDTEYLGRGDWPDPNAVVEREYVINPDVFAELARNKAVFGKTRVLAIDMAPSANTLDIAAAAPTLDGAIHVEVGYHGTAKHEGQLRVLLSIIDSMEPAALVMDKMSPAYTRFYADLVDLGFRPLVTNAEDMAVACAGIETAIYDRSLSHTGDPLLQDAIEGAEKRDLASGAWAWNRRANASIAPLVAITLARWGLERVLADQMREKRRRATAGSSDNLDGGDLDSLDVSSAGLEGDLLGDDDALVGAF